eukprot:jgi/Chrzof1/9939/Cz04g21130.t1
MRNQLQLHSYHPHITAIIQGCSKRVPTLLVDVAWLCRWAPCTSFLVGLKHVRLLDPSMQIQPTADTQPKSKKQEKKIMQQFQQLQKGSDNIMLHPLSHRLITQLEFCETFDNMASTGPVCD